MEEKYNCDHNLVATVSKGTMLDPYQHEDCILP